MQVVSVCVKYTLWSLCAFTRQVLISGRRINILLSVYKTTKLWIESIFEISSLSRQRRCLSGSPLRPARSSPAYVASLSLSLCALEEFSETEELGESMMAGTPPSRRALGLSLFCLLLFGDFRRIRAQAPAPAPAPAPAVVSTTDPVEGEAKLVI